MAAVVITSDGNTITIRAGRKVEHIDISFKTKGEVFDAVKYACISKNAVISDIELTEILQKIGA